MKPSSSVDEANIVAPVRQGRTRVWWLGGTSLAIRTPEGCLWIDPFFGPPAKPQFHLQHPPLVNPEQVTLVTAVLITHEHNDHCHIPTLKALLGNTPFPIYAPVTTATKIRREMEEPDIKIVSPNSTGEIADVRFTVLPGNDPMAEEGIMYLLETPGGRVLHPGDSLYAPKFFRQFSRYSIDVSCFSVGNMLFGEKAYMTPAEFGRAAEELEAQVTFPVHWDLWEEARLNPGEVEDWGTSTVRVLTPGEHVDLPV